MKQIKWSELLISIGIAELTGILSAVLSGNSRGFYEELVQAPLAPPGIVFPLVWTVLYALMGVSAYLIEQSGDGVKKQGAQRVYAAQLFVNFLWSIVFFRFERIGLSVLLILLLIALVVLMIYRFYKIKPLAAYLNLPYLLWLLFAAYLNIGVFVLN